MITFIVSCVALAAALVALGVVIANTHGAQASAREATAHADRAEAARDQMRAMAADAPAVLHVPYVDDHAAPLTPSDFGLTPGAVIRASYVRDHPEYPWSEWVRRQAAGWKP